MDLPVPRENSPQDSLEIRVFILFFVVDVKLLGHVDFDIEHKPLLGHSPQFKDARLIGRVNLDHVPVGV